MAEAIACIVIDRLASLATPYINKGFNLRKGVSKELASIKDELQLITAFLKDAEDQTEGSDSYAVKVWVRQVRNVAYQIEDILDEHVKLKHSSLRHQPRNQFLSIPYKVALCFKEMKPRLSIASSIADIREQLMDIQRRRELYNLQMTEQVAPNMEMVGKKRIKQDPRVAFLYPDDSDLVNIEHPMSEIFEFLNFEAKDVDCCTISLVGMGGIGKTTLAWKVYQNIEVKRHFYARAWIEVSQCYSRKNLLRNMLQQFCKAALQPYPDDVGQMDELSLVGELRNLLEDKRYMVVFDDVWDPEMWNYVKHALPNNDTGSKVLLTTRLETVALTCKGSSANNYIYKLKLLSKDKAWELFCKKAFQGDCGGQCPHWLEDISRSIVHKCEGLPLALVTVSGLLSTKEKVFSEWKKFRDSLGSELERNSQLSNITKILLLSYSDLHHYLKPCLVYFAMFPESSSIVFNRLLKLWTAEDFIRRKNWITIEDVAKEYMLELIQRSLVQVSVWYDSGRARAFRVHDLVYEILRIKLEDLNFCHILQKENPQVDIHSRRLSIQEGRLGDASRSITSKCSFHSVFLFGAEEASSVLLSGSLLKKVHLLKVLDLEGAPLHQIPEEVGDLYLLQYLSLRFTKVKIIPRSIGKLTNLLTLDLKRCPVWELPLEIGNLRKLRHLVVYQNTWDDILKVWIVGGVKILGGALGRLENLQKLADVNVTASVGFINQLSHFRELKYLAISNVKREHGMILCKAIEQLECLESLNITVDHHNHDPLDLQHVCSPPLQLQRLYLIGPLEKFPEWIGKLQNLNKLRFRGSKLNEIRLDILQNLPNLTMLGINKDVFYGERLDFQAGGFKKLRAIYFDQTLHLKTVEIEQGAMPLLDDLLIHRSPQLKEVPLGLQYLQRLTSLKLVEMPPEFECSVRPGGSLHHIVKHVADIRVGHQAPSILSARIKEQESGEDVHNSSYS